MRNDGQRALRQRLLLAGAALCSPIAVYTSAQVGTGQMGKGSLPSAPSAQGSSGQGGIRGAAPYVDDLRRMPRVYMPTNETHVYALFELIDIAEQQNPSGHAAWEQVKAQAAAVKVARSTLFPAFSLNAPVTELREFLVFPDADAKVLGGAALREDDTTVNPVVALSYLLFDAGNTRAGINTATTNLFVTGASLTDTQEQIALNVTRYYYRVVSGKGLVTSARASLKDAQEIEQQVQARMEQGLATLPIFLSTKAQRQQAEYNLENAIGAEQVAESDLARNVGLNPAVPVQVKDIAHMPQRSELEDSAEQLIGKALVQRPDLLEAVGRIRAADLSIKSARSALFPNLTITAQAGQDLLWTATSAGPAPFVHQVNWQGEFSFTWSILDGGRRRYQIVEAEEQKRIAQAQLQSAQDLAANQVWSNYINAKVAFRRLEISGDLLLASQASYDAAQESFTLGLETYTDLFNAEQTLAQSRNEQVQAASEVMTDLAQLAYSTGDLLGSRFLKANRNAK